MSSGTFFTCCNFSESVVTKSAFICMGIRFNQEMLLINIFCNNVGTMPDNVT